MASSLGQLEAWAVARCIPKCLSKRQVQWASRHKTRWNSSTATARCKGKYWQFWRQRSHGLPQRSHRLPAVSLALHWERETNQRHSVNSLSLKVNFRLKAGVLIKMRLPDQLCASIAWCSFLFSHPPSLLEIKSTYVAFFCFLELRAKNNLRFWNGLIRHTSLRNSWVPTHSGVTTDTLEGWPAG